MSTSGEVRTGEGAATIDLTVVYHAVFEEITGRHQERVTLGDPTFAALVALLDSRYGRRFGDVLLDRQSGCFQPGVIALADGRPLEGSSRLSGGGEVVFMMAIAGGVDSPAGRRDRGGLAPAGEPIFKERADGGRR